MRVQVFVKNCDKPMVFVENSDTTVGFYAARLINNGKLRVLQGAWAVGVDLLQSVCCGVDSGW